MDIAIYPIRSDMHNGRLLSEVSASFIKGIEKESKHRFRLIDDPAELAKADLPLILVQSGGSEGKFKTEIFHVFEGPYYLLTYGSSNSLAASLEILTFVHSMDKGGEILHDSPKAIANRLDELLALQAKKAKEPIRCGVLGKPSDWLIGSEVDFDKARRVFGIELIEIPEEEVIDAIKNEPLPENLPPFPAFDLKELKKAYGAYLALKKLAKEKNLEALTIRCFDVLSACHLSACLALALLNEEGIVASCEGDIPAMITAVCAKRLLGLHAFQVNPQWIHRDENAVEFAHCTLPLDMAAEYDFETHFESGIGLGIHGLLKEGDCTVLKIGASLSEFYVSNGVIHNEKHREDRCRTQVRIDLEEPVSYFLKSSLGNHHQIIYGHHAKEVIEYLESLGLRRVI